MEVAWNNGTSNSYRMGADGKFDLRVVESRPTSETSGEPSSSAPSEEGPSTEDTEMLSPAEPQQGSSSTSQDTDVYSEVLVEAIRVEDIPDEGIFTSDDIIESPGTETSVIVLEASGDDSAEAVPCISDTKETVSESAEVTEGESTTSEPVNSTATEAASTNNVSENIGVGETARRLAYILLLYTGNSAYDCAAANTMNTLIGFDMSIM